MPLIPDGLDATLVLVRHGESEYIVEERFQGQSESPLSAAGLRQAELVGRRLASPKDAPALPSPNSAPIEIAHSPLVRAAQTAEAIERAFRAVAARAAVTGAATDDGRAAADDGRAAAAVPLRAAAVPLRADPGLREIGQGRWEGLHRTEVAARYAEELAAWRLRPLDAWAPGGESLPEVQARVKPALAVIMARMAEGHAPGTLDRAQVAGYRDEPVDQPWSIVVGHDGVFKVALLTLFDLPLDRFWMWSMDLCGISIIELRAGRPVLRAHNLTAHLAGLLDDTAQAEQVERSRSGAL